MPKSKKTKKVKSKREERKKQTAEVFTPPLLVNQMLSRLSDEDWGEGKTFCDPACGNGNFLIEVLRGKLLRGHNSLEALKTVFGIDIMRDNIKECRERLLGIVSLYDKVTREHVYTVHRNIICLDPKKNPGGTLDYDFSFSNGIKKETIDSWMEKLDQHLSIDLPVEYSSFTTRLPNLFEDKYDDSSIESPVREALSRS